MLNTVTAELNTTTVNLRTSYQYKEDSTVRRTEGFCGSIRWAKSDPSQAASCTLIAF